MMKACICIHIFFYIIYTYVLILFNKFILIDISNLPSLKLNNLFSFVNFRYL